MDSFDQVGSELVFNSATVRVWTLCLAPGASTPMHRHSCNYVYVVTAPGSTVTHYADGSSSRSADEIGDHVFHEAGQPHYLENVGKTTYENVIIELLGQPGG